MFVNRKTLDIALSHLYGTAGHLLKIWFTLKHMGLVIGGNPVMIDTANSTPSLKRLFSCGAPDGRFYIPFAHTPRYLTIKSDAARSIIQTTVQRWASSGSVVTCDPTEYLDMYVGKESRLYVKTGRRYPFGLGVGESGFALEEGTRVSVPILSFAIWYGRTTEIPEDADSQDFLLNLMLSELHFAPAERELIFVDDDVSIETQSASLTDEEIFTACSKYIEGTQEPTAILEREDFGHYARRVKSMVVKLNQPEWMRTSPVTDVNNLVTSGAKSILLYGPPRTGKTRAIDAIVARDSTERCTIQIHDGWGYDHLIEGLMPGTDGTWTWKDGVLKSAIKAGKKFIVLEEINRTAITQALGEVFSLIEESYRGEENAIMLRSGQRFWIPADVVFFLTMNTIDKSTEEVDDALMGRVAAVEFYPRPEDLNEILASNEVSSAMREKIALIFAEILNIYPLGHGYFADLRGSVVNTTIIQHYKTRIRPVLFNFLGELKEPQLASIDNLIDETFKER